MIRFTVTEQQADQVLTALGQMPFLQVNGLFNELLRQLQTQQQEQQQQKQMGAMQGVEPILPNGAYNGPAMAVGNNVASQ